MNRLSLFPALLILTLAACDEQGPSAPPPAEKSAAQSASPILFSLGDMAPPKIPSWAGSYLSSRVAQERFDWAKAKDFLTETKNLKPETILLTRRLMLLAMGSGDVDAALAQAKQLRPEDDPSGLTHLILVLEPLRDGQTIAAQTMVDAMPKTSLGGYAAPLLSAWLAAQGGKVALPTPGSEAAQFYHAVILADYLNQIDLVANPAHLVNIKTQLNAISAERMGDIFLRHKKFDLAESMYKIAKTVNPNNANIAQKEKAAHDKVPLPEGIPLAKPVPSINAGIALVFFEMATTFYNDQGYESAQLFAQMALALDPALNETRLLLGQIFSRNDRLESAISIYQTIPETDPRHHAIQRQIAALQVSMEDTDAAIKTLELLSEKTDDKSEKANILLQIGDIYREKDSFDRALEAYDRALALTGEAPIETNWEILYARGMTLERLKKWDRAEQDLKAALTVQPEHPFLLNYLAYSWADQNIHLDEALKMLLKAVALAPNDGYITDSVGWIYYRMGQYDQAVDYLEQAVQLLPYDPTVNDHLGDAYARVNRLREARFQWRRALNYSTEASERPAIESKIESGIPAEVKSAP